MKKILIIVFIIFANSLFFAQNAAAIKLGFFNPNVTDGGFIIGFEGGKRIDEALDICYSIDWFKKNYTDKKFSAKVEQFVNIPGVDYELVGKTSLNSFPLMLSITAKIPLTPIIKPYLTGGFGGEMLVITYRDYVNPKKSKGEVAFDFNWRAGAGVIYVIGSKSNLFGEITYHNSMPSFDYEVKDTNGNKRLFERVYDMRGLMIRMGVRYWYW
jgi:hypothetical protein